MQIEEIKPGQVFKENVKNGRFVRILSIAEGCIRYEYNFKTYKGPFVQGIVFCTRSPQNFHKERTAHGFSLYVEKKKRW